MNNDFPAHYKLGETSEEVHISSAEENRNAAISLAKQARHSIDIFTQDMDAALYDNDAFEQSVFKLAKRHPKTKIRILAQDTGIAVRSGHRLIKLTQHLTSSVFINNPTGEHKNERSAFLIVDRIGLLYRTTASHRNYKASVNFMAAQRTGKLTEFFNEAWEHSKPDVQTRRVYI